MKNLRQLFGVLVLMATVAMFTSCNKDGAMSSSLKGDKALTSIPQDASMVMTVNMKRLMEKADFEEVKNMDFYQDMVRQVTEEQPQLAYIMKDPMESGVNLEGNMYVFVEPNPEDIEEMMGGVVMNMGDRAKFEAMLEKADAPEIVEKKGYSSLQIDGSGYLVWNDDVIFSGNIDGENPENQIKSILNKEADASIAANDKFLKSVKGDHDFSTYLNTEVLGAALYDEQESAFKMGEIDKSALTDNLFYSYMDFNNGEIVGSSDYQLSPTLLKDLKMIFKDGVKTDFSKHIPADNAVAVMTGGIDFKGLNQILQEKSGASTGLSFGLSQLGLEKKDVVEAMSGDVMVAGYANGMEEPNMLIGIDIGDKAAFDKVMDAVVDKGMIQRTGKDAYNVMAGGNAQMQLMIKDGIAFISNNAALLSTVENGVGAGDRIDKSKMNSINKGFMGMFMEFDALKQIDDELGDIVGQFVDMQMNMSLKKSESVIRMKDTNTNSLKQIFEMVNEVYKKENQINM